MLKPPFTVIIIKRTHEPLTVQVTNGMLMSVLLLVIMFCLMSGVGISILFSRMNVPFLQKTAAITQQPADNSTYTGTDKSGDQSSSGIGKISLARKRNNRTDLEFYFSPTVSHETMYVWLIINPDAKTAGETVIVPRNPVFRGVPIDYRNGFEYHTSNGNKVTIALSDAISGLELVTIKILAYDPDGNVIADRLVTRNQVKQG